MKKISRKKANDIIVKHHYSKKYYNASYIHLGVFLKNEIKGVLQFGYAMNPASQSSIVAETEQDQYLELNRMWLSDDLPRNSESMVISFSIKYIKRKYPKIQWIQSFADERFGGYGIVYQAANFVYCGEHTSNFWEFDNEIFHDSILTDSRKANTPKGIKLRKNRSRLICHQLRQFRYIYFINQKAKERLKLKISSYPKWYNQK